MSLIELRNQVRLAREGNDINRDAFISVQRAFIVVARKDEVRMPIITDQPAFLSFVPVIKNSGNTPTKDAEIVYQSPLDNIFLLMDNASKTENFGESLSDAQELQRSLDAPSDPDELFNYAPNRNIRRFKAVIGPKDEITAPELNSELERESIRVDRTLNVNKPYFYFGAIRYNDTFPHTKQHITKFCYDTAAGMYITKSTSGDVRTPMIKLCSHWNCADDECDKDKELYERERAGMIAAMRSSNTRAHQ